MKAKPIVARRDCRQVRGYQGAALISPRFVRRGDASSVAQRPITDGLGLRPSRFRRSDRCGPIRMPETCSLNEWKTWDRFDQFDGKPTNRSPCVCKPRRLGHNALASGKSNFRSPLY